MIVVIVITIVIAYGFLLGIFNGLVFYEHFFPFLSKYNLIFGNNLIVASTPATTNVLKRGTVTDAPYNSLPGACLYVIKVAPFPISFYS